MIISPAALTLVMAGTIGYGFSISASTTTTSGLKMESKVLRSDGSNAFLKKATVATFTSFSVSSSLFSSSGSGSTIETRIVCRVVAYSWSLLGAF